MDWQHLIMNGENLAEYAALLAAEGLLGHQHANSGWGTFDDDNMVGATAFMETLELAIELRRAGYGDNGERLGFDLYPYTEDAVGAVKRSVLQWRFIDGVAARIDEAALREAQPAKDAVRAYELVYAALGADVGDAAAARRRSRIPLDGAERRAGVLRRPARARGEGRCCRSSTRRGSSGTAPAATASCICQLTTEAPPDRPHFCLVHDELEELRARLEAAGVETRDPTELVGRPRVHVPRPVRQPDRARAHRA